VKQGWLFNEDQELDSLARSERELARRRRELDAEARRLESERIESACTLPPSDEIRLRCELRKHQQMLLTRGEVANLRREQNLGLLLLMLLVCATASLVWWGFRLMQG
jgi:hypothetical protein